MIESPEIRAASRSRTTGMSGFPRSRTTRPGVRGRPSGNEVAGVRLPARSGPREQDLRAAARNLAEAGFLVEDDIELVVSQAL